MLGYIHKTCYVMVLLSPTAAMNKCSLCYQETRISSSTLTALSTLCGLRRSDPKDATQLLCTLFLSVAGTNADPHEAARWGHQDKDIVGVQVWRNSINLERGISISTNSHLAKRPGLELSCLLGQLWPPEGDMSSLPANQSHLSLVLFFKGSLPYTECSVLGACWHC